MRIGFVSTYPPIECGIATYTESLTKALRAARNETFVVSQFGAQGERVFALYQPQSPSFAADVFYTSTRLTPDVMHIQHEYGLYGTQKGVELIELILRYRLAGLPVVTTLHTVYERLQRDERILLKPIVENSQAVIVHEAFQKDTLVDAFGMAERIHVIEHGVREIEPIQDAKAKLGLEGKKVILLAGYFRPSKGFHKIVERFPEIAARDPDVVLVVAGKVRNIEFDDYQREFFTRLNASPVLDRIRILRGQFPQYTFDTILSAADVMVLPYERGAQSGMFAQALALQRPVVASNLRAFRLLAERSGAGLVVDRDEDWVETILRVLSDDALRRRMQANARRYVRERASWRLIARRHVEVYHGVVTVPYGKAEYVYFPEPEGHPSAYGEDRPLPPSDRGAAVLDKAS
ncbi:MAG TPA: glycosyltransferase [Chromatiales bacterium]|nr:glycosyltransferase [Chromatiales bacterium]